MVLCSRSLIKLLHYVTCWLTLNNFSFFGSLHTSYLKHLTLNFSLSTYYLSKLLLFFWPLHCSTVAQNRTPLCHYMLYTSPLQQWLRTDLHCVTICYTHHHFSSTLLDSGSEQISIVSLYVIHIITSTVAQNRTPLCHYMLYTSSLQFHSPGRSLSVWYKIRP